VQYPSRIFILLLVVLAASAPGVFGQTAQPTFAFSISMPQPTNHIVHVTFRSEGLKGELQDFKMPVWSPGFYGVGDYSRNVSNFQAEDGAKHALPWEKVTKDTWRVAAGDAHAIVLNYDVYGATSFAANTYVGDDRAYLSPSGVFVYVPGMTQHPVTVTIESPSNWKQISTGLEPARNKSNTFYAPNFDVLYDSPILMGNQEYLRFDVKGVPHFVAIENLSETVDRKKMIADLQKMVTAATQLIGAVPYKHYTFLMMGRGNGGIEHLNSASIQFDGKSLDTPAGYLRWLSYVSHEYFHNFNVKRIRPIALGPFNYDMENLTHMLWVSEGLSVYYENLVLVRAGLMTRDQYLEEMTRATASFDNSPGHHYQSATESSWNTWNAGSGVGGDRNTSISYYDNGAMLGAMLDLKIRSESKNLKSLDDVMRALYKKYYLQKRRGFTDAEFRQECESAAGGDLTEVFSYAESTTDADYAKYFELAGLALSSTAQDVPGAYLGVNTHLQEAPPKTAAGETPFAGRGAPEMMLMITSVTPGSPAETAGLKSNDQIVEVEGMKATPKGISDLLTPSQPSGRRGAAGAQAPPPTLNAAMKNPGDRIKIQILRDGALMDLEVILEKNVKRAFTFELLANPTTLQATILNDWLRTVQ
jgi:predicted metalloprotease with PDZ domain